MTISNYGDLKGAIADTLNRQDMASAIPTFVKLAEAQFNRKIRSHRQITRGSLTLDNRIEALPADWQETIRITSDAGPVVALTQISLDDITRFRTSRDDTAGSPIYFAHTGTDIELFPTPGEAYTAEITYYAKITSLAADGDTNWLLTNHPDAYLYGSLVHTAPYLKDDARLVVWAGLLAQAMNEIEEESTAARFGSPLRMRMR
jgi:hypothetical protein